MKTLLSYFVLTLFLLPMMPVAGQTARVRFDVPQTVAVRDITTREFAAAHPADRLIEVVIPISMLLEQGDVQQVTELFHRLEIGAAAAQVVDFSPKTTLTTTVVGSTRVERQSAQDSKISLDIAATYAGLASGKLNSHYATQAQEQAAYEQLPSLDVLTASGTIDRGRGVYFKLKASPRTTLEGAYDYVVILRVPRAWRAGLLYVSSRAVGDVKQFLTGTSPAATLGQGRFVVALYEAGDAAAQNAARNYALAEAELKRSAAAHRDTILHRIYPTPLHKLGVTRDDALDRDWLETALYRGYVSNSTLDKLPDEVRQAVKTLITARRNLLQTPLPSVATIPG